MTLLPSSAQSSANGALLWATNFTALRAQDVELPEGVAKFVAVSGNRRRLPVGTHGRLRDKCQPICEPSPFNESYKVVLACQLRLSDWSARDLLSSLMPLGSVPERTMAQTYLCIFVPTRAVRLSETIGGRFMRLVYYSTPPAPCQIPLHPCFTL